MAKTGEIMRRPPAFLAGTSAFSEVVSGAGTYVSGKEVSPFIIESGAGCKNTLEFKFNQSVSSWVVYRSGLSGWVYRTLWYSGTLTLLMSFYMPSYPTLRWKVLTEAGQGCRGRYQRLVQTSAVVRDHRGTFFLDWWNRIVILDGMRRWKAFRNVEVRH
jgi:hypothetical protein